MLYPHHANRDLSWANETVALLPAVVRETHQPQDFLRRSSRVLERALGEKEALDVLLDYAGDEGDSGRGDQGQRLNEAMTLHEVSNTSE